MAYQHKNNLQLHNKFAPHILEEITQTDYDQRKSKVPQNDIEEEDEYNNISDPLFRVVRIERDRVSDDGDEAYRTKGDLEDELTKIREETKNEITNRFINKYGFAKQKAKDIWKDLKRQSVATLSATIDKEASTLKKRLIYAYLYVYVMNEKLEDVDLKRLSIDVNKLDTINEVMATISTSDDKTLIKRLLTDELSIYQNVHQNRLKYWLKNHPDKQDMNGVPFINNEKYNQSSDILVHLFNDTEIRDIFDNRAKEIQSIIQHINDDNMSLVDAMIRARAEQQNQERYSNDNTIFEMINKQRDIAKTICNMDEELRILIQKLSKN